MEYLQQEMTAETWSPVDSAYLSVLRVGFCINHGILIVAALLAAWFISAPAYYICLAIFAVLICSFLWWCFVWAPKSSKRMLYLLREEDINLQKGVTFWKMVSISSNRIQHLEVRQGPIERHYGLATLIIYTAGTQGSDLKIPGLTLVQAQQLKTQLLSSINAEAVDVDEPL